MNFKLTIALVILLALAALTFMLVNKEPLPTPTAGGTTPLFSPAPGDIRSITYIRNGVVEIKFEKSGADWKITNPFKGASAESFTVDGIARALQSMAYQRKFEPESSGDRTPEATGTAKPADIVKFTDDSGKEYTLNFGKHSTAGYFATLNSDKAIYVLSSSPISQLDQEPDNFRNKQIKQIDTSKITKLDVKTAAGEVKLAKSGDKWLITAPISARANAPVVDDIVKQFGTIRAEKFTSLDRKMAGVDDGSVAVTAWLQDQPPPPTPPASTGAASQSQPAAPLTPITLQFGVFTDALHRDTSAVYASLANLSDVFTLTHDAYSKVNKELKDLRDTAVTPAPVSSATELTISTDGATTVSANKKDNVWNLTSTPSPLVADPFAISEYFGEISNLRAIKFVDNAGDLKSIGLDPPHMKIELTIPSQSQHEVLFIGTPETADNVTPVMRQGEPTVYLLQSPEAAKLAITSLTLRDKDIEQLNADKIRKIEIAGADATPGIPSPATAPATAPATGPGAATAPSTMAATAPALPPGVTLEREGLHWQVNKNGTIMSSDDPRISAFLGDFTPLNATKYLDEKPINAGTPDITVTLSILESAIPPASAPSTSPATATAPAAGPVAATTPATTPATTRATLAAVLPSPAAMGPDPGKIITRTLKLYKEQANNTTTWKAVWDHQDPAWTFQPTPSLINHLTREVYAVPATQPASQPATKPAG